MVGFLFGSRGGRRMRNLKENEGKSATPSRRCAMCDRKMDHSSL